MFCFLNKALLLLYIIVPLNDAISSSAIRIRGHENLHLLPLGMIDSWRTWTYSSVTKTCEPIENAIYNGDEGWVNPTSVENLYLPADLPIPKGEMEWQCQGRRLDLALHYLGC